MFGADAADASAVPSWGATARQNLNLRIEQSENGYAGKKNSFSEPETNKEKKGTRSEEEG